VPASKAGFVSGRISGVTIWLRISRSPATAPTDVMTPNTASVDSFGNTSSVVLARKNQIILTIWMIEERFMKNSPRFDSGKRSATQPHQHALVEFAKHHESPIATMMMTIPRSFEPPRAT
jgi:hypothetical protein